MAILFNAASSQGIDIGSTSVGGPRPFFQNVGQGTISLWFARIGSVASARKIISISTGTDIATPRIQISTFIGQLQFAFRINDGDATTTASDATIPSNANGQWNHLLTAIDFTTATYRNTLNGVAGNVRPITNGTPGNTSNTPPVSASIGTGSDLTGFFNGMIDDVRFYNALLSPDVASTIHAARGKDGILDNLVTRWQLSDGPEGNVVDRVTDISGNGYFGQSTGSPVFTPSTLTYRNKRAYKRSEPRLF